MYHKVTTVGDGILSQQGLKGIVAPGGGISDPPPGCPPGVDTVSELCYTVPETIRRGVENKGVGR